MRVRTAVLLAFASLTLIGASRPLNPLVPRVANERAVVSAECAEGAIPAPMPRIEVAEIPVPEQPVTAPPSAGLRTQLRDAQAALTRDDRRAFDTSLGLARETLANYPPGGERTAAQNIVRIYEDAAVLWDAQFVSPFFGEESAAYRAASGYNGWSEAIRRQVLVDDRDRRFYPARESRQFLASVAATRLERLGVRTPAVATPRVVPEEDDPGVALPSVRPRRRPGKVETHASTEPRRSTTPRSTKRTTRSTPPRQAPTPERAVTRPTPPPVTAPPPPPAPIDTAPVDTAPVDTAPVGTAPVVETDTGLPATDTGLPSTDTATTTIVKTTDTTPSDTVAATDTTATTATGEPAATTKGRNLVIPLLLILVGIGVLIVLFRASS